MKSLSPLSSEVSKLILSAYISLNLFMQIILLVTDLFVGWMASVKYVDNMFTWPYPFQIALIYSDYPNPKYLFIICIMFTDAVDNIAIRKRSHLPPKRI